MSLAEVIEDADALIGALLKQRRQRLELEFPEDLPRVDGDGPRLTQVFVNLLANASKFAPEDSVVRVGAVARGRHGDGLGRGRRAGRAGPGSGSIFERFSRGPGEEPEPGGLGLGLWIVKSIVDRHGGSDRGAAHAEPARRVSKCS